MAFLALSSRCCRISHQSVVAQRVPVSVCDPVHTCVRVGELASLSLLQCVCVYVCTHVCMGAWCGVSVCEAEESLLLASQQSLPEGKCHSQKPSQVRLPGNVAFSQKAVQAKRQNTRHIRATYGGERNRVRVLAQGPRNDWLLGNRMLFSAFLKLHPKLRN